MKLNYLEIGIFIMLKDIYTKGVNTVLEAVPVWPAVRYILDTGQYWYTVSGLPLFFIFINICVCVYVCVRARARVWCIYYNKYKSLS